MKMRTMKDSGIAWIGEIPESWDVVSIQRNFDEIKEINKNMQCVIPLQYKYGKIVRKQENNFSEQKNIYTKYLVVKANDIMINGLNLSFDFITQRVAGVEEDGIITSTYIGLRPKATVDARYATFLFKSYDDCKALHSMGRGLRSILSFNEFKKYNMLYPSLAEQKKIADFLDWKCAEIDELVQTEEKMIEELKAYKQSVITEAVTKGLDPAAPMKDSGIEWIGKIPASWEVGRMKYVADINAPCKDVKQYERISYAPMECIKRGWMECQEISPLESSSGLTTFEENDIVMAKVTPCFENGNIAVAKDLINGVALGSSELFVFRARTVLTEWLFYFLQNSKFTDLAKSTMVGTGGLKRVSPKFVSNYQMGVPSLDEQKQIADYLDEKCAKIDEIIALRTEQINQLKEYKKSLIYEHVTGKKEVV